MNFPPVILPATPPRVVPSDASRRGWRFGWSAVATALLTAAWLAIQS